MGMEGHINPTPQVKNSIFLDEGALKNIYLKELEKKKEGENR